MAKYRSDLPQLGSKLFASYLGMDTEILFRDGIDLPGFASYPLLQNPEHKTLIRNYYRRLADLAREQEAGLILDSVTWVANRDRGAKLGFGPEQLKRFNIEAIELLAEIRQEKGDFPTVLCGQVGPRGDGYMPQDQMSVAEAEDYHAEQIGVYRETEADFVAGSTLCYPEEASGIVRAARQFDMPVAIAFTVEIDGKLPTGIAVKDAIEQVDEESEGGPLYYQINCAHPVHFTHIFTDAPWMHRLRGVVANASRCSHAELDESTQLDEGDPDELGTLVGGLRKSYRHFNILGGCCGSNLSHMKRILQAARR